MKTIVTSKKLASSVGISLLAAVTTCTNVCVAADISPENTGMNENGVISEPQAEPQSDSGSDLAAASKSISDAQNPGSPEHPIQVEDDISENLNASQEAVGVIQNNVEELDALNRTAEEKNEAYTDIVTDESGISNQISEHIPAAKEAAAQADIAANTAHSITDEKAAAINQAQAVVYESSSEAAAAKKQAQDELDAAESAFHNAKQANEDASEKAELARIALDFLKQQKENAESALNEAKAAAANAQAVLEQILSEIHAGSYSGNAKAALDSAKAALDKATEDVEQSALLVSETNAALSNAQTAFDDAILELEDANLELESAENEKAEKQALLKEAESALALALAAKDAAQQEYITAEKNALSIKTSLDALETLIEEKRASIDSANAALEYDAFYRMIRGIDQQQVLVRKELAEHGKENPECSEAANDLAKMMIEYQLSSLGCFVSEISDYTSIQGDSSDLLSQEKCIKVSYMDEEFFTVYDSYYIYFLEDDGTITLYQTYPGQYECGSNALMITEKDGELYYEFRQNDGFADASGTSIPASQITAKYSDGKYEIEIKDRPFRNYSGTYTYSPSSLADRRVYDTAQYQLAADMYKQTLSQELILAKEALQKALSDFTTMSGTYSEALLKQTAANETLNAAASSLTSSESAHAAAAGSLSDAEKRVTEMQEYATRLNQIMQNRKELLENAKSELSTASTKAEDTKTVQASVKEAYEKVKSAIEGLKNLQAQASIDDDEYIRLVRAYNSSVEQYLDAVKTREFTEKKLEETAQIIELMRAAVNTDFLFNSSVNTGKPIPEITGTISADTMPVISVSTGNAGTSASVLQVRREKNIVSSRQTEPITRETDQSDPSDPYTSPSVSVAENLPSAKEDNRDSDPDILRAEDTSVPLTKITADQNKLSWWHLLILLFFGAAGYELYCKSKRRKIKKKI